MAHNGESGARHMSQLQADLAKAVPLDYQEGGKRMTLDCGHEPISPVGPRGTLGGHYGTDSNGKRHCYACCAELDKADMRATGRATLYLTFSPKDSPTPGYSVCNWPGSETANSLTNRT
jgi:hypothetical protein